MMSLLSASCGDRTDRQRRTNALATCCCGLVVGLLGAATAACADDHLPPLRLNAASIESDALSFDPSTEEQPVAEARLGGDRVVGLTELPPPSVKRIADKMTRITGRDPSWILGRVGIVLSIFVGLVWVQNLFGARSNPALSNGAIQVCGKVRLDAKQSLHLVRIGQRLLVLLESPQGVQRLAEITDPDEVDRLLNTPSQTRQTRNSRRGYASGNESMGQVDASAASELLAQIRGIGNA